MDFEKAIKILNKELEEKNPKSFSSSWISKHAQSAYNYFRLNHRTDNNCVDWDAITVALDRSFQRKWIRYKRKQPAKPYEDQKELDFVLNKYQQKLYVFIAPSGEEDRNLRNRIIIALVRVAQKGNVLAKAEIIKWLRYIADEWIDKYPQIYKWQGYPDEVDDKIADCVRCYKYTGSFIGYLFRTLEYSARGKPPQNSVDDKFLNGKKTRIDFIVQENESSYEI